MGLGKSLDKLCCHPKLFTMATQLHEDQLHQIRYDSDKSQPFPIMNGVNQGCVLAFTLLSVLFSMMQEHATADLDTEKDVYIRLRADDSFFDLRLLHVHSKLLGQLIRKSFFAGNGDGDGDITHACSGHRDTATILTLCPSVRQI